MDLTLTNREHGIFDSTPSGKMCFYDAYRPHQTWSLPNSIIYYITKNPSSSVVYQKMTLCCKYFFVKNPILVIRQLNYYGKNGWNISYGMKAVNFSKLDAKIWMTSSIYVCRNTFDKANLVSSIFPKFYRCDLKYLHFRGQVLSFNDFCFLSSFAENISFYQVTVKNDDGSIAPFEKLVETVTKAKHFTYTSDIMIANVTSRTFQNLVALPHFRKLTTFQLDNISEAFDLDAFYAYMKENKFTKFRLHFDNSISKDYKNRVEKIIDEIIKSRYYGYIPPFIYYNGIANEKREKLFEICEMFDN